MWLAIESHSRPGSESVATEMRVSAPTFLVTRTYSSYCSVSVLTAILASVVDKTSSGSVLALTT